MVNKWVRLSDTVWFIFRFRFVCRDESGDTIRLSAIGLRGSGWRYDLSFEESVWDTNNV
jgi:hypothetical protein